MLPAQAASPRFRWLIERCAALVMVVLVARAWFIQGLLSPYRVTSSSMAETLRGPHREIECGDCGKCFAYATEVPPPRVRAVCPNCGYSGDESRGRAESAGDGLIIDKSAFQFRRPRRWEVVAFRHPRLASQIHVKRVAGLPGETVQIRRGDVYIDGRIARKTISQQRALAVPVHDARFRPTRDRKPPPRWLGEGPYSQWGSAGGRFAHPGSKDRRPVDWLVYHHWRQVAVADDDTGSGQYRDGPITDLYGYNQTRPRREEDVHAVTDLMLSFRIDSTSGAGRLVARAVAGRDEFHLWVDPAGNSYEVRKNGRPIPQPAGSGRLPGAARGLTVEISLFDQQFLVAFNRQGVVDCPWTPDPTGQPARRPLAIGSEGLRVALSEVRVYRDVYYTHPIGQYGRWGLARPVLLGRGEYFVLGDNSPVSDDSRTWPDGPAVPAKLLLGKPLVVHWPGRLVRLGKWEFQVPKLAEIRYIR